MDRIVAEQLNQACHCIGVDREALHRAMNQRLARFGAALGEEHQHLFSSSAVFVGDEQTSAIADLVAAVATIVANPGYRALVLDDAAPSARVDPGTRGLLLSYDFHLTADGPRLIEVNTNAGGVLLAVEAARVHRACCAEVQPLLGNGTRPRDVEQLILEAFRSEWANFQHHTSTNRPLRHVAIVDSLPKDQFLYAEFLLYRALLESAGLQVTIADPSELQMTSRGLLAAGSKVDFVYNRLTDFYLTAPAHQALRQALEEGEVAMAPVPQTYALYADKSNLVRWSRPELLRSVGVNENALAKVAASLPPCHELSEHSEEEWWRNRKEFFFKPRSGYASRGAYDGVKLTRSTLSTLVQSGDYIAQQRIPPSQRSLILDGEESALKIDLRAVVYADRPFFLMARLYRGQTTNLRTKGGGLAVVFPLDGHFVASREESSSTTAAGVSASCSC